MRAFVYLRQSLDRTGQGAAVDRQREDCVKLCSERGWEVVQTFIDNDTSATSRKPRPAYVRMLAAVEQGEAEVIVSWHVDRLTRKLTELEHLIELSQNTGLRIATATGDLDLTTDSGRLVGRILASVARGEIERKGARQRRAQQQAAEQGKPAGGRRAFGYGVPTGETRNVRGQVRPVYDMERVNEAEAAHIRQAYADVLQGASLKSVARRWNDAGLTTTAGGAWRHDNVREVLRNPRNRGLRTYRGEVVGPATWPPLVDDETHETVTAILSLPERRTTDTTARRHLLPGLALCWKCGSDVATGHTRHGKRVYVCRAHKCISRAAQPIDELVEAVVIERLSRPDAAEMLTQDVSPDTSIDRARTRAIRDRLDDLATGLEEGVLTLAAVRRSSDRLRQELAAVEARIQTAAHADALAPVVHAPDVAAAWAACDLAQRRAIISAIMTVTLLAPKRGRQQFEPETVAIEWMTNP